MEINKQLLPEDKRKKKPTDENALGFGTLFTDHILKINYNPQQKWHNARIEPYGPLELDPACMMLHYGQQVFEGMKAYIGPKGEACMFRPKTNFTRMLSSAQRLCIADFPVEDFMEATFEFIRTEKAWIPRTPGTSLYVRPIIIATDVHIGVSPSKTYLFYVIAGPVGAYYPEGFNPVKIYVEQKYIRAAPGGLGETKTVANYAASLLAQEEAHRKGFTQVLWLDVRDKQSIEEVGTMNIFFVVGDEVVTPALNNSILPGVTRDSVLTLCRHWNMKVSERKITIDELAEAHKKGELKEAFGTGTAAIISPVGEISFNGAKMIVNDGKTGALSQKLYDEIVGIQMGQRPDPFNWVAKLD